MFIKDSVCTSNTPVLCGKPEKPIYGKGVQITPAVPGKRLSAYDNSIYLSKLLPQEDYDKIVVFLSGDKDSICCLLRLLELSVPKSKIECWHHDIDGGNPVHKMDWPVTLPYVRAFCAAMGIPLRVSWRVNGFFGEVYRLGASYPIEYEDGGEIKMCPLSERQRQSHELRAKLLGDTAAPVFEKLKNFGYRMKFPAKAADLERRWCSSVLKISVSDALLRNLEELKSIGHGQFPAKGRIENGRWCSAELKREVGDRILRDLAELNEIGRRMKLPAKGGCHQGRWCSGSLKAAAPYHAPPLLSRGLEPMLLCHVNFLAPPPLGRHSGTNAGKVCGGTKG